MNNVGMSFETFYNENILEYIVICNIRDTNNKSLKLQMLNNEFELIKKGL